MDKGQEFADAQTSVAEIVETKALLDKLPEALAALSEDERGLIGALFFEDKSERQIERETGIPRKTLAYRRNWILTKLKNFMGDL